MKGYSVLKQSFTALLFCLLFVLPIIGQEPEVDEVEPPLVSEREFYQEGELAEHWDKYNHAIKSGDTLVSDQAFEEIREFRRKEGNPVMESVSLLFLQNAKEAHNMGNTTQSRLDYLHAIQMNPYLWPAYVNLGEIKVQEGKGWKTFISMYIKGLTLAFSSENTFFLLKAVDWFLGNLIWVLCFSFFLYTVILCSKYIRPHLHVFLADQNTPPVRIVLAAGLLFLPLILGFNYYLIAGTYIIMFFPFFTPIEKRTALFVSSVLVVIPLFLGLQVAVKSLGNSAEFKFRNQQFYLGDPSRQAEELNKLIEINKKDEYYFSLGVLKQKLGDYKSAMENYEKVLKGSEFFPYSQVNIGTIFFLGQKYQNALTAFETASTRIPNLTEAIYNKSAAYSALGKHMEAEKALLKSKSLDARKVENWQAHGLSVAQIERVQPRSAFSLLQSIISEFANVFRLEPPFILSWIFFIIILIFSFVHSGIRNPRLLPQICAKCGKIYYPSESPNSDWCSQCVHIYMLKSDLPNEAKIKKHSEVKSFIERKNRFGFWAHVLVPGTRTILNHPGLAGWFSLFFWVLLLRFCFTSLSDINYMGMREMTGLNLVLLFTWGTTALFWVIFGLRAAWQED